jgi:hypothetical protein
MLPDLEPQPELVQLTGAEYAARIEAQGPGMGAPRALFSGGIGKVKKGRNDSVEALGSGFTVLRAL